MATNYRTYRLTATGVKALKSEKSVPTWYRAILTLGFVESVAPVGSEQPAEVISGFAFDVVLVVCGPQAA